MFAPWMYGTLDSETQSLLSYSGWNSMFVVPEWVFWVMLLANLAGYIGMFMYKKFFRLLFSLILVVSILLSPIFGMSIITGIEVFFIDASMLLAGIVLALAYFTPINDKFN